MWMIEYTLGIVLVAGNIEMDKTHEGPAFTELVLKQQEIENKKACNHELKTQKEKYQIEQQRRETKILMSSC